jgi:hypothetical protein
MPQKFWSLQREGLAVVPTVLRRWRVAIEAVRALLDKAGNPLNTVLRLLSRPER